MSKLSRSLAGIAASAGQAFARYPAAMASALVIALSASWLVQVDRVSYGKPYQSLQLGFLLAAGLGMTVAATGVSRLRSPGRFVGYNLGALAAGLLVFVLVNASAGDIPQLTVTRVIAATAILLLVFVLLISRPGSGSDYSQAAFMTFKSAMVALLYGLVILLGLYFITFTIQALLYSTMSSKVYQHVAIWSAFLAFAFFLGAFPDFTRDPATERTESDRQASTDPRRETAQKQPRFAEVLFLYVLVPLMTVLTAVLLAWAVQILVVRTWPSFGQLASILSAYALAGIWLYIMVSRSEQPSARFYRLAFPPALLVLLAFETYALVVQVRAQGFKPPEYAVLLLILFALAAALAFLGGRIRFNHLTAVAGITLLAIAVLPFVNYQAVTVFAQSQRLEAALARNGMFAGDRIQPATATVPEADKVIITDAAGYLLGMDEARKPGWFEDSITSPSEFSRVFGFQQTYPRSPGFPDPNVPRATFLTLPQGEIDIGGYQRLLRPSDPGPNVPITVRGQRGVYGFTAVNGERGEAPAIQVTLDGRDLVRVDLKPMFDDLADRFPDTMSKENSPVPFEAMTLRSEQDGARFLFVFQHVEITSQNSERRYQFSLHSILFSEG